jgi:hypothetical protein
MVLPSVAGAHYIAGMSDVPDPILPDEPAGEAGARDGVAPVAIDGEPVTTAPPVGQSRCNGIG